MLSCTVSHGKSAYSWKTIPRSVPGPLIGAPSTANSNLAKRALDRARLRRSSIRPESRSSVGLGRARARQVAQSQVLRNIDRLRYQIFFDHCIDRRLDGDHRHAAIGIAIVIAPRCKITVEHLFWRLREGGNEFDGFVAIGLVVVPIESGNIVGEEPAHGVWVLVQEFGSSHLEDHGRRAKRISAGEQRPQIALAAFNGKEWNDKNATIDSLFPYRRRHVRE